MRTREGRQQAQKRALHLKAASCKRKPYALFMWTGLDWGEILVGKYYRSLGMCKAKRRQVVSWSKTVDPPPWEVRNTSGQGANGQWSPTRALKLSGRSSILTQTENANAHHRSRRTRILSWQAAKQLGVKVFMGLCTVPGFLSAAWWMAVWKIRAWHLHICDL